MKKWLAIPLIAFAFALHAETNGLFYIDAGFTQDLPALAPNLCGWVAGSFYDREKGEDHYYVWFNLEIDYPPSMCARIVSESGTNWLDGAWADWAVTNWIDKATGRELVMPTARDYVQDGLVAMFDGIQNTTDGAQTRDPTQMGLVVGGGEVRFVNGAGYSTPMSDLVVCKDDGVIFKKQQGNTYSLFFNAPGILSALNAGLCTLEMCVQPCADGAITSYNAQEWGLTVGVGGSGNTDGFRRWMQDCESLCCSFHGRLFNIPKESRTVATFNSTKLTRQTHTAIASATSSFFAGCLYENGVVAPYTTAHDFWAGALPSGDDMCIRSTSNNTRTHDFRVFNVRFYDRRLTDAEIARNYEVDRVRFMYGNQIVPCRELVVPRRNANCVLKTGTVITLGGKDGFDADIHKVNIEVKVSPYYDAEVEYLESTGTQLIDTGYAPHGTAYKVSPYYDAEVAYLESTGTQLIDTGYAPHGKAYYEIDFMCRTFTGSPEMEAWGIWGAGVEWNCWANRAESTLPLISGTAAANVRRVYGGTLTGTSTGNIGLFSWVGISHPSTGMLLYRYQVKEYGELVQDFIPVRVGTVGYMFDRVSKQLFGNSGTGEFIVGPDTTTTTTTTTQQLPLFYAVTRSGTNTVTRAYTNGFVNVENGFIKEPSNE